MELEELIKELEEARKKFGNIPVMVFQHYGGLVDKTYVDKDEDGFRIFFIDSE